MMRRGPVSAPIDSEETMRVRSSFACVSFLAMFLAATASAQEPPPYTQHENIVYAEVHGIGLLMDVFVPDGRKNGLAIVDVISGAWHSDRGKIRDHIRGQTFHILCGKGYTVFAVRPGSISRFSAPEMLAHVNLGIRWVKDHAQEYAIDPDRLGLMGASAGGHLACLAAVTASTSSADTPNTRVKAVAVFFPPTDFLDYGGRSIDVRSNDRFGEIVRKLAIPEGLGSLTDDEVAEKIKQISPGRLVTAEAPPFLLIHGDADPVVPLQQSEVMLAALQAAGVPAELIVKPGGGHPWPTIPDEVAVLADWFDRQLADK
jgi:acetyl esterase/lipase